MLEATLAILNAHVVTLNPKGSTVQAIAIRDGKIIALGSNRNVRKCLGKATKIIDAKHRTVVPGFVDCHVHMTGFGQYLQSLELRNVGSIKEIQLKLRDYTKKNREKRWILGGRWDQERFSERRYPTRWDLDTAVADKPVFLTRVCGHVGIANSKALELANITEETAIEGGNIELDPKTGKPNGVLRENALELVWKTIPKPTPKDREDTCIQACENAVKTGLTCVHWMVGSHEEIRALQRLYIKGKLPLRVYLGIPIELLDELASLGLQTGFGNDMIKIGFVKILADGSLGGHTAALKEPYADKPETCGMMLYKKEDLSRLISKAHKADLQVAIHAIGDHAVDVVLKAFEKALKEHPKKDHRHRVEHCSVLNPKLIKRMKRLKLVASIQPHFVVSDFWAVDRVGKIRGRWVYPFKTLVSEGLIVASGSDCPVEPISPVLGIWAAVARKSFPEESLTVEEALKTYTINAAYASFDEKKRGTIEVGKLADLTILSDNLSNVQPEDIQNVDVNMTIVDGKIVYACERFKRQLR